MNITSFKIYLVFVLSLFIFSNHVFAQKTTNVLVLTKNTNQKKIKHVAQKSSFRLKTIDGKKIKGKFAGINNNYIYSTNNDTIYLKNILWIKARKQLTNWEKAGGISAFLGGGYLSLGAVPAALYFSLILSNYWVILAPVATLTSTVVGFRIITGRRYKMKNWELETQVLIN